MRGQNGQKIGSCNGGLRRVCHVMGVKSGYTKWVIGFWGDGTTWRLLKRVTVQKRVANQWDDASSSSSSPRFPVVDRVTNDVDDDDGGREDAKEEPVNQGRSVCRIRNLDMSPGEPRTWRGVSQWICTLRRSTSMTTTDSCCWPHCLAGTHRLLRRHFHPHRLGTDPDRPGHQLTL